MPCAVLVDFCIWLGSHSIDDLVVHAHPKSQCNQSRGVNQDSQVIAKCLVLLHNSRWTSQIKPLFYLNLKFGWLYTPKY